MSNNSNKVRKSFSKHGYVWYCDLFDRISHISYTGTGDTKKEAEEDAWDKYYGIGDNSESESSNSSSNTGLHPSLISLIGAIVCGYLCNSGYQLFQDSKHQSVFTVAGGLGPVFGLFVTAVFGIGFLLCIYLIFATLFWKSK